MNWNRNSKSYSVNEAFVLGETLDPKSKRETIRERSDSQSSVEDDDEPVTNPRGLPTKAQSIDFGLDDGVDKRKPYRDCLTGCFVVFFVLATMACVSILLYFILINTVFAATETKTLTGELSIEGSVLLNETYKSDLADPQSMAYREMENEFLASLNASFSDSALTDVYDGAKVERFEQGSIRIIFTIFLLSAPNDADTEVDVIVEVQVTMDNGINSGFFDAFNIIENSLDITTVNEDRRTTTDSPTTTPTEVPGELTTVTAFYSATSPLMLSLSTLLSTPVVATAAVTTTNPPTTPIFSTHSPASPTTIPLTTPTTTSIPSTTLSTPYSTTKTKATSETVTTINNSTGTFHFTSTPTTVPLSSTDLPTSGTILATNTPSAVMAVVASTSPTTIDNATGSFHFTIIPTTIPPSQTDSTTSDTALTTTPSITRMITAISTVAASSTTTTSTTTATITTTMTTETVAVTNGSFANLTTTRPPSTSNQTSTETILPTGPTTTTNSSPPPPKSSSSSSSASSTSSLSLTSPTAVNITRQPKIYPALPDVCGIRAAMNESGSTARIVGGTQSAQGTWPWIGSLRRGGSHQCGAVLIHQEWAITAHHCVGFFDNIVLGDNDLYGNSETSPYRVQRNVQAFPNSDFDHVTDTGDIALVRLIEPVEFNDYVQPLCINTLMTEMTSFNNCYVAGWGTDDILDQVAMRYLLEARIQMFHRRVCSQWYQAVHTITDQHICAGEEDGRRDACSGDSGGPLQCQDDQGIWYLLGVVSFGEGCGQPMLPGVYTRVSTQIPFLSEILDTNIK